MRDVGPRKKKQILKLVSQCKEAYEKNKDLWIEPEDGYGAFNFPDYGGLPKKVADKLSPDCVDVIQEFNYDLAQKKRKVFNERMLAETLIQYYRHGYAIP